MTLYDCKLWTLNKAEERNVESWERKILQRIHGIEEFCMTAVGKRPNSSFILILKFSKEVIK